MYAVIETGGKQLRVEQGSVVEVEQMPGEVGSSVVFDRVLMVGGGDAVQVGKPVVEGACVRGTVVAQDRGPKIRIYTFKRRQNSNRRKMGHRQSRTSVKIDAIES